MRPGRKVAAVTDRDARIRDEYAGGREIPEIAARYAVDPAYVERVIEDATLARPARSRWSPVNQGNRIFFSVLVGWLAWFATGRITGWTFVVVAVVVYVVTSIAIGVRRR